MLFVACSKDDFSSSSGGTTTTTNVSDGIKSLVAKNYAGYTIYEVEREDWCNDQQQIKIGIKNGSKELHLFFDLSEKFLFEARRIAEAQLPAGVANSIKNQYTGYEIKDENEVEELTYPDASKRYYVRLRKSSGGGGSDVRIMFNTDGKVFCQKN
ncbi:PepSY-like domain-containing protein [Haliscomenobacter hydrossis]|uniref:Uncharacterized protein n=1 Tax=Haliscomenobacter hydrossis (strain ATCC 27775 / DSM 1100 / LMG 10767 / O) TaxID=760192 RepID=F4L2F1_HALH1|nr:PepSY-like domain-containing protein [Haliscomenobacter hydrossis]AEE52904.1 hypothetical protein Halhy_5078 [Haliscomenobacter hydrossis DSM 1100]